MVYILKKLLVHVLVFHHAFQFGCIYIINCVHIFKHMYTVLLIIKHTPGPFMKCIIVTEVRRHIFQDKLSYKAQYDNLEI